MHVHEGIHALPDEHPVFYFSRAYLLAQNHQQPLFYQSHPFEWLISIDQNSAMSMPGSPFGSVFTRDKPTLDTFLSFCNEVKQDLKKRGVASLQIRHPSILYPGFVPGHWFEKAGFVSLFTDINQHIVPDRTWEERLHKMEKRKLNTLKKEGFEFKKTGTNELEKMHRFISDCRKAQGLHINISLERLIQLHTTTSHKYESFGLFKAGTLTAAVIMVQPTRDIVYYYLPATHPDFRSHSPMVLLLASIVDLYRKKGVSIIDLGVSSKEGQPQEGLRLFKERMGALETEKPTYFLTLSP